MNKYVFKPYNQLFPELFAKEKARINEHLFPTSIEHVGSTSVPELGGKGIIDIAIAVEKQCMEEAKNKLQELSYEFRPSFSTPERFYLVAYLTDPEENIRRYHIHLTYLESKQWKELITFRDYLRTHPEAREEYANIKKKAADMANHDGEQYRKIKEPIIEKALSILTINSE